MKYRKRPGRVHLWHNHPSCPAWPTDEFLEHEGSPKKEDICPRCASIAELESKSAEPKKSDRQQ